MPTHALTHPRIRWGHADTRVIETPVRSETRQSLRTMAVKRKDLNGVIQAHGAFRGDDRPINLA